MGESDKKHIPVACTLDAGATAEQLDDWAALQALCARVERTPRGAVLWFEQIAEERLRSVVGREAACCRFLDLDVRGDGELVRLEIASDAPSAEPVIDLLATQASGR